jgi:hypothetical protein
MSWAGTFIQDGEAGVAVYRIAHQSLADHIRPPFVATHQQVFDPEAQPVAETLLSRYAALLANGVPVTGPGYLWRYAWRHAATAGPAGLVLIRGLAAGESQLLADVAMADLEVAGRLGSWGYRLETVAPAEEAVRLYKQLRCVRDFARKQWPLRGSPADVRCPGALRSAGG